MILKLGAIAAVNAGDQITAIVRERHSATLYKRLGYAWGYGYHGRSRLEKSAQEARAVLVGQYRGMLFGKGEPLAVGVVGHNARRRHGREPLAHVAFLQAGSGRSLGDGQGASPSHGFEQADPIADINHAGEGRAGDVAHHLVDELFALRFVHEIFLLCPYSLCHRDSRKATRRRGAASAWLCHWPYALWLFPNSVNHV